jgi:hypothetical protein
MSARVVWLGLLSLVLPACGGEGVGGSPTSSKPEEAAFEQAKLLIEHNATDLDTGFQGFVDGDAWKELHILGPNGHEILHVQAKGKLRDLGLTELFFESEEPANAEVPIPEMLANLPEGTYTFKGKLAGSGSITGTTTLSHTIPKGPVLTAPSAAAVISPAGGVVFSWQAVTESLSGGPVNIASYELIVEKDVPDPFPNAFAAIKLSIHLPPSVTSFTVSSPFFQAATSYKWEVLAIEQNGNQTLSSGAFSTQ